MLQFNRKKMKRLKTYKISKRFTFTKISSEWIYNRKNRTETPFAYEIYFTPKLFFSLKTFIYKGFEHKKRNAISYQNNASSLAAESGFEPEQNESESFVLPLHNSAKSTD